MNRTTYDLNDKDLKLSINFVNEKVGECTFTAFLNNLNNRWLYNFSNSVNMFETTLSGILSFKKNIIKKHSDAAIVVDRLNLTK